MAFDEDHFEENSFWTRLVEQIKIMISSLKKALTIQLQYRKIVSVGLSKNGVDKNINVRLRMKKI